MVRKYLLVLKVSRDRVLTRGPTYFLLILELEVLGGSWRRYTQVVHKTTALALHRRVFVRRVVDDGRHCLRDSIRHEEVFVSSPLVAATPAAVLVRRVFRDLWSQARFDVVVRCHPDALVIVVPGF
jgi:hypothetical protein